MKYENEIFKILCALSLMMILSIIFINKCNAQTFVDTTQQNKNIILEEFTGKCEFIDLPRGLYIINHSKIFKTQ